MSMSSAEITHLSSGRKFVGPFGKLDQWQPILHSRLVGDLMWLYALQVATYILPLLTLPYLARVLQPLTFGLLGFTQSLGYYIILLVEFGFALSATRDVSYHRNSPEKLTETVAGVMGARVLLSVVAVVVVAIVSRWVAALRANPLLLWAGVIWALSQGCSLTWYFQGRERLRFVAVLDISAKVLATGGIFGLVRGPSDAWMVLALQGCASFLALVLGLVFVYREISFRLPGWGSVVNALRGGLTIFLFRASISLYTVGNAFILGLFALPIDVGYYVGPEKLSKGLVNLLGPLTQVLYPRLSYLVGNRQPEAVRLIRLSLLFMGTISTVMGAAVGLGAPYIVRVVLGPQYGAAIPVLRIFSVLIPILALSMVLGIQWMLPLRQDCAYNVIVVGAGLFNLGLATWLAPRYAHIGMAWSAVASEAFVTTGVYCFLRCRRLDPFRPTALEWGCAGTQS